MLLIGTALFAAPHEASAVAGAIGGETSGVPVQGAAAQAAQATTDTQGTEAGQGLDDTVKNAALGVVTSPIAVIAWLIFKIASLLLGLAGILFNWTMTVLVFGFGQYLGNSSGMLLAWGILRDFANIGLLFSFIFLGIATILDLHSFPWKKTLPLLIIYAVLLNFSLFITEVIIDSANVLATVLYRSGYEVQGTCGSTDGNANSQQADAWVQCAVNNGVGAVVLEHANLSSSFQRTANEQGNFLDGLLEQLTNPVGNILKFLGLALLVTVAAMVFFAATFLFLSRAVVLAFLMATAPIGFAGLVIPYLKGLAEDWWKKLINQAFFAPVFLLLLLIGLKLTEGLGTLGNGEGLASALSSTSINTGPLLVFALVIAFMIAALMVAGKFGIYAGDLAIKTAGSMTFGALGFAGRRAFGEPARRIAQGLNRSRFGTETMLGRNLARLATATSKQSFDARSSPLGAVAKGLKVDLGKPSDVGKKGRAGEIEAAEKRANEEAKAKADARAAKDKEFAKRSTDLKKAADLEDAKAVEARQAAARIPLTGLTDDERRDAVKRKEDLAREALAHEVNRNDYNRQRAENEQERKEVKQSYLDTNDRALQEYYERQAGADGRLTKAAESLEKAAERLAAAEAQAATARATGSPEEQRLAAQAVRIAEAQLEESRRANDLAKDELQLLQSRRNGRQAGDFKKESDGMLDPKYAMEQYARSLEELSRSVAGLALDTTKLRAGAAAVRKNRGKSHEDHVWDEVKELMKHSKHEEHAKEEDHSHDAAAGAAPHAPTSPGAAPH